MDPSYNNPQYYPPPQQNYPPGNPYPPQQGYSPYQSPQQGYLPANSYQSPQQQPQNPNLTNNIHGLDDPWFKCYKIVLYIVFGLRIWQFAYPVYAIFLLRSFELAFVFTVIITIVEMVVMVIQFNAINKKDLQKAKIALMGFIGCYCSWIAYQIFIWLRFNRYTSLGSFFTLTLYFVLCLNGSVKVYQTLNDANTKEIKSNNYNSYYTA